MLKLKLNSIWVKIHKLLPSKVELKLSLSNPFSPGYQLPAKCVHLKNCEIVSKTAFKTWDLSQLRDSHLSGNSVSVRRSWGPVYYSSCNQIVIFQLLTSLIRVFNEIRKTSSGQAINWLFFCNNAITYRPKCWNKVHVELFSDDQDSSLIGWMCFSGALERSKHMHRKYMELTIKEMLSIVVKLARCTLRSILYAIVFILNLASYTQQRVNYDCLVFTQEFMK